MRVGSEESSASSQISDAWSLIWERRFQPYHIRDHILLSTAIFIYCKVREKRDVSFLKKRRKAGNDKSNLPTNCIEEQIYCTHHIISFSQWKYLIIWFAKVFSPKSLSTLRNSVVVTYTCIPRNITNHYVTIPSRETTSYSTSLKSSWKENGIKLPYPQK